MRPLSENSRLAAKPTSGGFEIVLTRHGEAPLSIGFVDKEGFFRGCTNTDEFHRLTPKQLREVADFSERHIASNR